MYELYQIAPPAKDGNFSLTKIAEGTRKKMGALMNYKRHNPNTQQEKTYRYAMYRNGVLMSSTMSGGGLNAGR